MDILKTTEPRSDQLNYDDVSVRSVVVTVSEVKEGSPEQPVELHLKEFPGRPYKPAKSMRRVLIACWGMDAESYVGRRLLLYGDPSVRFGGQAVGGIRIAALSDLSAPKEIALTVTRGKRAPFVVHPLDVDVHVKALSSAASLDELQSAWRSVAAAHLGSVAEIVAAKDKRKAELSGAEK